MAVMDIQVTPRREGTISVSDAVAAAQRIIEESGLDFILHPMGTCVEGEPAELYKLAARIHARLEELDYPRIGLSLKVDHRRDKQQRMLDKLRSVERKLQAD